MNLQYLNANRHFQNCFFIAKLVFSSHHPTQALYFSSHTTRAPSSNYTMWLHARQEPRVTFKKALLQTPHLLQNPLLPQSAQDSSWLSAQILFFREIVSQDEGKKCLVIFPSPFFPHLSSQCSQEAAPLPVFQWPHTWELLLPSPSPPNTLASKQALMSIAKQRMKGSILLVAVGFFPFKTQQKCNGESLSTICRGAVRSIPAVGKWGELRIAPAPPEPPVMVSAGSQRCI